MGNATAAVQVSPKRELKRVRAEDLLLAMRRGEAPAILDVREEGDFGKGHIAHSLSTPDSRPGALVLRLAQLKSAVLVCDDERLSAMVGGTLGFCGYSNVAILGGGLRAWRAAGGKLVSPADLEADRSVDRYLIGESASKKIAAVSRSLQPRVLFMALAGSAALLSAILFFLRR